MSGVLIVMIRPSEGSAQDHGMTLLVNVFLENADLLQMLRFVIDAQHTRTVIASEYFSNPQNWPISNNHI